MPKLRLALLPMLVLAGCAHAPPERPAAAADAPAPASLRTAADRIADVPLIERDALFGNPERTNVQVSPDGASISWIAPVDGVLNVWVAPAGDLSKARAVTRDTTRGIRNYFWSYRPGTLLYLRDTGGDEDFHLWAVDVASGQARDLTPFAKTTAQVAGLSPERAGEVLVGMNDRDAKWHDLYRVDLATGRRTLVEKNDDQIGGYLADAGFAVRYATRSRADGGTDVLQPDGKGGWRVFTEVPFEDSLTTQPTQLSADGRTLYMVDSRNRNTAALFAIDTTTGRPSLVLEDARVDLADFLVHPRTNRVQAASVDYLREEVVAIDPAIRTDLERLRTLGPGLAWPTSRTLDDSTWIVNYWASDKPGTFYRYDRASGALTRLFDARPALAAAPLVRTWPHEIRSRDGKTLVSYLTLPRSADADGDGRPETPVPLVLDVHGGPWARDAYGYSRDAQWLANRGYAVLSTNFRGSTGFGKAFTNAGDGQWGTKMQDDLLDAVQWAVGQGVTTADNVAIMGGSYGGYATLAGLAFTPTAYRCGVSIVGPSNLNTLLATVPPYWASFFEQLARRMGDPRTDAGRAWLTERSPLNRAGDIVRPLLIGQGANDPRVKQAESDQIVQAMQARSIPVTYVLFPDEGHGFARPENATAFNAVTEGFLASCLGGRAQPIGDDFAGSSITVPVGAEIVRGLPEALRDHVPQVRK